MREIKKILTYLNKKKIIQSFESQFYLCEIFYLKQRLLIPY